MSAFGRNNEKQQYNTIKTTNKKQQYNKNNK